MACENDTGVRNVFLTFNPCQDEGEVIAHREHFLAEESELPTYNLCVYRSTVLSGDIVKKTRTRPTMSFSVVPQKDIPSGYYTGCAEIDVDFEFFDGTTISGRGGVIVNTSGLSKERVSLDLSFKKITESRAV